MTSHTLSTEQKNALQQAIAARMAPYTALQEAGEITEDDLKAIKLDMIKEEAGRFTVLPSYECHGGNGRFSSDELKRQPWLKDMLNQRDLWKRHEAAVMSDPAAWESDVTNTFLAKAAAGSLSPLLTLIGQYLLFSTDKERGRRHLLEILYKQPASTRLKIHNWAVLTTAPVGTDLVLGEKVEHLSVPLFPWGDVRLQELNAKILDLVDACEGGSLTEDTQLRKMFTTDDQVLRGSLLSGGGVKPVLDPQGQPTGYVIDTQDIEDAFAGVKQVLQTGGENINGRIMELEQRFGEALQKLRNQRANRRHEVVLHHYPQNVYYSRGRGAGRGGRGYGRRNFRGGAADDDEEGSKNM